MTDVEASLNHYSKEVDLATYTFFVWKSINNIAVGDKEILTALRRNALSWGVITHSLQCTFFICLGRIFDDRKDSFSIHRLLKACRSNISVFSSSALRLRRREGSPEPDWLDEFMAKRYEPSEADFASLEPEVEKWAKIFKRIYKPVRHKIFAHKDLEYMTDAGPLFSQTKIGELECMLSFLHSIERYVWELLHNGRKYELHEFPHGEEDRAGSDVRSLLDSLKNKRMA